MTELQREVGIYILNHKHGLVGGVLNFAPLLKFHDRNTRRATSQDIPYFPWELLVLEIMMVVQVRGYSGLRRLLADNPAIVPWVASPEMQTHFYKVAEIADLAIHSMGIRKEVLSGGRPPTNRDREDIPDIT